MSSASDQSGHDGTRASSDAAEIVAAAAALSDSMNRKMSSRSSITRGYVAPVDGSFDGRTRS